MLAGRRTNAREQLMARRLITDRWAVRQGARVALCGPTAAEREDPALAADREGLNRKIIYATQAAAMLAAYELTVFADAKMWVHPCPRSERHWHLTSQPTPLDTTQLACDTGRYRKGERWIAISYTSLGSPATAEAGPGQRARRSPAWWKSFRRARRRFWRWLRRWGLAAMLSRKIHSGASTLAAWLTGHATGRGAEPSGRVRSRKE